VRTLSFFFLSIFTVLTVSASSKNAIDSLDIKYIDKIYITEPSRGYRLLQEAHRRLAKTGWRDCSRERFEYVAGYVCLENFRYDEAYRHALVLQQLGNGEKDDAWLKGMSLQCAIEYSMGEYGRLTDTFWEIRKQLTDNNNPAVSPKGLVYGLLECDYYQILCEQKPHQESRVLKSLAKARADMQELQRKYPQAASSCIIFRHTLDRLEADIYIYNNSYHKAAAYIPKVLAALVREQRKGGDGVTDGPGYDIHRLDLYARLSQVYASLGRQEEAMVACDSTLALLKRYPHSEEITGRLLDAYSRMNVMPPKELIGLGEEFVAHNMGSTSPEMRRVCEILLEVYTKDGETQKSLEMVKVLKQYGEDVNRARRNYAAANDSAHREVSALNRILQSQYNHKLVLGGGILLCLVVMGLLVGYHRRLVNSSHFLNRQIKKTVESTVSKIVEPKDPDDVRNQVSAILSKNNLYCDANLNDAVLEKALGMKVSEINNILEKKHLSVQGIILDLRLRYACMLLESTDYVLEFVAEKSGFSTLRTFYRQFKKKYNLTPSEYRRMSRDKRKKMTVNG
jgi:AraC-like DNA-binding protein